MREIYMWTLLLAVIMSACSNDHSGSTTNTGDDAGDQFMKVIRLDSAYIDSFYTVNDKFAEFRDVALKFYKNRGFNPAWFRYSEPKPQVNKLLEHLENAGEHGLVIHEYTHQEIKELEDLSTAEKYEEESHLEERVRRLDLAMTNLFFQYAKHLYLGVIDPNDAGLSWYSARKKTKLDELLVKVLSDDDADEPFAVIQPDHKMYYALKEKLAHYRELKQQGGLPKVSETGKLEYGDSSDAVVSLKKRLSILGDYPGKSGFTPIYDSTLTKAVANWQDRHGLKVDGVIGPSTLTALNRDVDYYIEKIIINMERFRWIPDTLGNPHILVNIPDYKLYVNEGNEVVMEMKVVTGKAYNQTVVFSDSIEYIEFSPYWNVPYSIATEEILPILKRNPGYLAGNNMELLHDGNPVSPHAVDWPTIAADNFPYRIRQKPGLSNSLGTVKFIFPNQYNIYLHDTPAKHLFEREERAYSHGCIRIEKPLEFAKYLLWDNPDWDEDKIEANRGLASPQRVYLDQKVPVYILYFTSWVDESGNVYFIEDVYDRDVDLKSAIFGDKIARLDNSR